MSASPLILDLDGDGIEITQHTGAITFDHDANGIETGTAWAGADDGLLVLDRDGNGSIDTGRELFGNNTLLANGQKAADGYAALRELDSNADGVLDASDAAFAHLRVWRDLDQDGNSDAGELFSLDEVGVSQIGLSKAAFSQTLADGTRLDGLGSFTLNGQTRSYTDAWFAENPFYREFASDIEPSEDVAALPGMKGSGAVRDLQEAAMLSEPLRDLLEQFQAATTREAQRALIEPILIAWAGTSDFVTVVEWQDAGHSVSFNFNGMNAADTAIWRERLAVLEAFNAQNYAALSSGTTTVFTGANRQGLLQQSYDALYDSVYGALVMQTRLTPYLDAVELVIDDEGVRFDSSGIDSLILQRADTDVLNALADLLELRRYGSQALHGLGWSFEETFSNVIAQVPMTPEIAALLAGERVAWIGGETTTYSVGAAQAGFLVVGNALNNTMTGNAAGAERLIGGAGNDTLTAVGNYDVLDGGEGDDALNANGNSYTTHIGGAGNDTITGSTYADTYVFNRGDGADVITDSGAHSTSGSYSDRLIFGQGITEDELWFSRSGNDLLVQVLGDGGQVEINNWYASPNNRIEQMQLSDGQALLFNQVDSLVSAMAAFAPPAPGQTTLTPEQQTALAPVIAAAWN